MLQVIVVVVDDFECVLQCFMLDVCCVNVEWFFVDMFWWCFFDYVEQVLFGLIVQCGMVVFLLVVCGLVMFVFDQSGVFGGVELLLFEIMKYMCVNVDVLLFVDGLFCVVFDEIGVCVDVVEQGVFVGVCKQGGVLFGVVKQFVWLVCDVVWCVCCVEVIYVNI